MRIINERYLFSEDGLASVLFRREGRQDTLEDTKVRAVLTDPDGPSGVLLRTVRTDGLGLIEAQRLVARAWPNTELDVVDAEIASNSGWPLIGTSILPNTAQDSVGIGSSDIYVVIGAKDGRRVALHPVAALLCMFHARGDLGLVRDAIARAIKGAGVSPTEVVHPNDPLPTL